MITPYKDLELSKKQIRILKSIKLYGYIDKDKIYKYQNTKYRFLMKYSLIEQDYNNYKHFVLSDRGEMLLRYRNKDRIRFWVPIVISVFALIISIIALCK